MCGYVEDRGRKRSEYNQKRSENLRNTFGTSSEAFGFGQWIFTDFYGVLRIFTDFYGFLRFSTYQSRSRSRTKKMKQKRSETIRITFGFGFNVDSSMASTFANKNKRMNKSELVRATVGHHFDTKRLGNSAAQHVQDRMLDQRNCKQAFLCRAVSEQRMHSVDAGDRCFNSGLRLPQSNQNMCFHAADSH